MLPIQTRLKEGGFLLLDGAMGTMLQAAQAPMGKVPEAFNITHPELIRSIHQNYLEAGAEVMFCLLRVIVFVRGFVGILNKVLT